MRMRRKKNLLQRIERASSVLIKEPQTMKGRWRSMLSGCRALYIELGCGKGKFTTETAMSMPDVLIIAIERYRDALITAMERAVNYQLPNVRFICADVSCLCEMFEDGEADRIYINFCDPWPGARHEKRRLTSQGFLERYRSVLRQDGEIHFKTDNRELFDYSVHKMTENGFVPTFISENLHENGINGIMTDYEEKFYREGKPICMLTARNAALAGREHKVIEEAAG